MNLLCANFIITDNNFSYRRTALVLALLLATETIELLPFLSLSPIEKHQIAKSISNNNSIIIKVNYTMFHILQIQTALNCAVS